MPMIDSLSDALPDLVIMVRRDGVVLSHKGGRGVGALALPQQAEGQRLGSIWPESTAASVRQAVRRAIAQRATLDTAFTTADVRYEMRKFRLSDNRMVGVEALLRWCDAEHGEIPPTRFIEIAEDSGLIIDLGAWVIRAVCRQLRAWQDAGLTIPVAINVSGKELLHGDPTWTLEAEARREIPIALAAWPLAKHPP